MYVKGEKHRRVIDVNGGKVVYCIGGDTNRVCKVNTFYAWTDGARLEHAA